MRVFRGVLDLYAFYAKIPREKVLEELLALQRANYLSPAAQFAGGGGKPPHRRGGAPCHLHSVAAKPDPGLRPPGKSPIPGPEPEEIHRLGYKTTPVLGFSSLAKRLREKGLYLAGVPGFYKNQSQWTLKIPGRGILIPVRDIQGQIQGLQVRLDNVEKRKFRWLSSNGLEEGCGAKTWVHLAGEPRPLVLLTEGPMKA